MERPNVLQIVCHDLGRHLGCYGMGAVHTPALDRIAAEGVRFANAFCTAPGCSPSRAALATGRYPHSNGCMGLAHAHFGWDLAPGERHTAQLLAAAGYQTVLFGLQHVTYQPERLGFATIHPERPADAVAAAVAAFLAAPRGTDPFYAEINFFEPHRPFDFGGIAPDRERGVAVPPYLTDDEASRGEAAALQGAIRKVDAAVARIVAALDGAGLGHRSLLLFTADHGLAFPRAKGSLYDAGIEVALLVRWPSGAATGIVREELVSNVDVLPTFLEAAGVPVPENVQGQSFRPLLRNPAATTPSREAIYAEKTYHEHYDPQRCVRTHRHKLIQHFEVSNRAYVPGDIARAPSFPAAIADLAPERGMLELYDLVLDPGEQRNLADDPDWGDELGRLGRRLREWMRGTDDPLLRGPIASPYADRARARLEAF
jgi:arylsulfatase A-like enzyme